MMRPGTEGIFCPIFSYSIGSKNKDDIVVDVFARAYLEGNVDFFIYANNVRYDTAIRHDLTILFVTI